MERASDNPAEPLLRVEDLSKHFRLRHGAFSGSGPLLAAVDRVSFSIGRRQVFGLAGESGSGKSTLGRAILQLTRPDSGKVLFQGQDLVGLRPSRMQDFRRRIQIIFQDPATALSPRRTIQQTLAEPLDWFGIGAPTERKRLASDALNTVGLDSGALPRFPHQFSSGQRQRICIARALLADPDLVIADEAVAALDVSVQAQILELILQLRNERGISFLFISHDLAVIRHVADIVGVMYRGQLVESGPRESLFRRPLHPYTQQLLAAVPDPDPAIRPRQVAAVAGLIRLPKTAGCVFAARCLEAMPQCLDTEPPVSVPDPDPQHRVKCHLYDTGHRLP